MPTRKDTPSSVRMSVNERKLALVVGGSRGIGRAIATRLARSDFDVWLTYRSRHEEARDVQSEIEGHGARCRLIPFDVSDYKETLGALEALAEREPPEVVVYNAAITKDNLLVWMTKEEWDAVVSTNLDGFFHVMRAVLSPMIRARRGRIVVISSASGQVGRAGQMNYSASKAGLIGAAKALAREVGKRSILVNVVAPGMIETEMTADLPKDEILPLIPLNRIGTAEDVASLVDFLCSEEHMYIHGQVLAINGGLVI